MWWEEGEKVCGWNGSNQKEKTKENTELSQSQFSWFVFHKSWTPEFSLLFFFLFSLLTNCKMATSALSKLSHTEILSNKRGLCHNLPPLSKEDFPLFAFIFKARRCPEHFHSISLARISHTSLSWSRKINRTLIIGSGKLQFAPELWQKVQDRHPEQNRALLAKREEISQLLNQ